MSAKLTTDTQSAAKRLAEGGLVAIPTETVYGLAADAENPDAVASIYRVKHRPNDHPVIVHISNPALVAYWAREISDYGAKLAKAFWPGPMTLILFRKEVAKNFITGGQDTVGIRIPNHAVTLNALRSFEALGGHGVAAPSANRYGAVSPTTSKAVMDGIGSFMSDQDLILEGGATAVGVESTIIDCTGLAPAILRPGAITVEMIQKVTGLVVSQPDKATIRVSGSHKQHYSPRAKVVLNKEPGAGDGLIALSSFPTPQGVTRLAAPENLEEYAKDLYAALIRADELGIGQISIYEPAGEGIAIAIRDRVRRAAAKG